MFLNHKTQPEPLLGRKGLSPNSGDSVGTSKAVKQEKLTVSSQATQEEGIFWTTTKKEALMWWNYTVPGLLPLLCEEALRKQKTSNCRSALIRYHHAHSWVTLMYRTKFGTKEKKHLFEKHWHLQVVTFLAALWAFDHMPAALSSLLLHGKSRPRQPKVL